MPIDQHTRYLVQWHKFADVTFITTTDDLDPTLAQLLEHLIHQRLQLDTFIATGSQDFDLHGNLLPVSEGGKASGTAAVAGAEANSP
jgi:hypothetical protein